MQNQLYFKEYNHKWCSNDPLNQNKDKTQSFIYNKTNQIRTTRKNEKEKDGERQFDPYRRLGCMFLKVERRTSDGGANEVAYVNADLKGKLSLAFFLHWLWERERERDVMERRGRKTKIKMKIERIVEIRLWKIVLWKWD